MTGYTKALFIVSTVVAVISVVAYSLVDIIVSTLESADG
jgi:hypothetical protein